MHGCVTQNRSEWHGIVWCVSCVSCVSKGVCVVKPLNETTGFKFAKLSSSRAYNGFSPAISSLTPGVEHGQATGEQRGIEQRRRIDRRLLPAGLPRPAEAAQE